MVCFNMLVGVFKLRVLKTYVFKEFWKSLNLEKSKIADIGIHEDLSMMKKKIALQNSCYLLIITEKSQIHVL